MPNQFDGPEFERLLRQARRSLERTGGELSGSVSLSQPGDAERKAIIGITGQYRPAQATRIAVRLADLDRAVRETTGRGLPELLADLGGPLRDRPAERDVLAGARDAAIRAAQTSSLSSCAWYQDWLAEIGRDGTLTKLVGTGEQARLGQAVRVLEYLAGRQDAPVLLPALAAEVTGDTKALNHGTVLSTLVLRALAGQAGTGRPRTAGERRELWEAGGVVVDDLASRVLVLNLPAEGPGLAGWLAGAARHGVPFYVTLHQLMTFPLTIRGAVVHVCENPAVLRHATAALGPESAPLVCTEGRRRFTSSPTLSSAAAVNCAITVTSTGPGWPSRARSCAVTAPGRGGSAPVITWPGYGSTRSMSRSQERPSRRRGIRSSARPWWRPGASCSRKAWPTT
jgi:uncharacterized protein (TIGR02679 family)